MSTRFGRNKRRAAREAINAVIAEADARAKEVARLKFEAKISLKVARAREEKLVEVQRELDEVVQRVTAAFGEHSVMLKPKAPIDHYLDAAPDYFQLARREPLDLVEYSTRAIRKMSVTDMCEVISMAAQYDHWAHAEHFHVINKNRDILAYVLPERVAKNMPRRELATMMARELGARLADLLQEPHHGR